MTAEQFGIFAAHPTRIGTLLGDLTRSRPCANRMASTESWMADEHNPEGSAPPPASGGTSETPKTPPAKPAAAGHAPPKPPAPMAATAWEAELPELLKERFGQEIVQFSTYLGQNFVV